MKRFVSRTVLLFLLVFALPPGPLAAWEPMRMVYFENFPPFSWKGEDGTMHGILVDVMEEAAGRLDVEVSHKGYPWARAQQMVREGAADAFVTIPTPAREEYTLIGSVPVVVSTHVVFTKAGHERMDDIERIAGIEDLRDFRILDYVGNGWAEAHLAGFERHMAPKLDNVLLMLAGGRGDIGIFPSFVGAYAVRRLGLQEEVVQASAVLDEAPFHLCIGKESPYAGLLADFDRTLQELRNAGRLEEIYDGYR